MRIRVRIKQQPIITVKFSHEKSRGKSRKIERKLKSKNKLSGNEEKLRKNTHTHTHRACWQTGKLKLKLSHELAGPTFN